MSELLDQLRGTCGIVDPAHATTLPPAAYRSPELYELEQSKIFRSGWQGVCRIEQVAEPGSYYSIDLLGRPLVVTRDRAGGLHVLSRTCQHRWMEVVTGAGQASTLQCPYHLWTYGLDGRLLGAPLMNEVPGFDKETICLPRVRHEVWHGFVFVNLDGTAEPLAPQLARLDAYLENYELDGYRSVDVSDWDCPWDWKIMVDNFMECYHHLGPHRDSLEDEYPASMSWTDKGDDLFSIMHIQQDPKYGARPPFLSPGSSRLRPEQLREILIFTVYPHFMISLGPGFLYWMKVLPEGPGKMRLQLDICMSGAAFAHRDRESLRRELVDGIIAIHQEDVEVCAAVQRAVEGGGVDGVGRLALIEQPLWELYRYLGRQLGLVASGAAAEANR
ncbi:MAG: aromatic ring-hydroxylating oxygenase subunit alpha [Frankia sp.]